MEFVEPIRSQKKIDDMRKYLYINKRNHLLFVIGISSAFRVSDLLNLQYKHIIETDLKPLDYFQIREGKTGKGKKVIISKKLKKIILEYVKEYFQGDLNEYVFKSRKGKNNPITRTSAYKILKQASLAVGIKDFGTHSMRKTFSYHYYQNTGDIATLQKILNHSSSNITLRYIGIEQDEIDKSMESYSLL